MRSIFFSFFARSYNDKKLSCRTGLWDVLSHIPEILWTVTQLNEISYLKRLAIRQYPEGHSRSNFCYSTGHISHTNSDLEWQWLYFAPVSSYYHFYRVYVTARGLKKYFYQYHNYKGRFADAFSTFRRLPHDVFPICLKFVYFAYVVSLVLLRFFSNQTSRQAQYFAHLTIYKNTMKQRCNDETDSWDASLPTL